MKKIILLSSLALSVCLLSACSQNKIVSPKSISSSDTSKMSKGESKSEKEDNKVDYDKKLAEKSVKSFMTAYFDYDSGNSRISATKPFCTLEVQKDLGLTESKKDIVMDSNITSLTVYQSTSDRTQYIGLVETTINNNQVTPQVVKITVKQTESFYLVSDVNFPVMK
ncbi:EF0163 family protein [Pseudolactococcus paracarnosus]|uniref:Lipoprotein n=1 Tax=Pseudolactococcus paracarnosus TaxID=2749962 RepID=A0ABT0AP41_9LACT|nr:EF0163 family protein [Lactococcus paracarnosus]MCJ1978316.1 hypothetical protein [Lactococcus paracarnosus]MCJ1984467.1 hypothetical protein [Lactococcus paracarnosus]MCJ1999170.1 hypothetical protein [Lactococcus paracarnosus]